MLAPRGASEGLEHGELLLGLGAEGFHVLVEVEVGIESGSGGVSGVKRVTVDFCVDTWRARSPAHGSTCVACSAISLVATQTSLSEAAAVKSSA